MNYFDIIIIIPLLWAAYKGYKKGFVIEVASLVALLLGIWGALKFSGFVTELIIENFETQSKYLPLISFAVTFILIVVGVHFVAKLVDRFVKAIALNFINRIAGAAFGIVKVAFIVSVILSLINQIDKKSDVISEKLVNESLLYKPISDFAPLVFPSLKEIDFNYPIVSEDKAED